MMDAAEARALEQAMDVRVRTYDETRPRAVISDGAPGRTAAVRFQRHGGDG